MKVVGEKFDYSNQRVSSSPEYVLIESTNLCNLRCPTCSRETLKRLGSMPFERFEFIMSQLPNARHVKLHGLGETFLAKDIMKMLFYLREHEIDTVTVTNGNWKRDDHDEILSCVDFLYFSIDGYDKKSYEAARPGGRWETVVANIRRFVELKGRHKTNLLINFVCQANNTHYMPKMVELCHQLGVDALRINVVQSWVDEKDHPDKFKQLQGLSPVDITDFVHYYKKALRLGSRYNFDVEVIGNEQFSFNQCIWPFERSYITWEGEMVPCCMRPDPIYSAGNIITQGIDAVWHSKQLNDIRASLSRNKPYSFCTGCPYKLNAIFLKKVKDCILQDAAFDYSHNAAVPEFGGQILRKIALACPA